MCQNNDHCLEYRICIALHWPRRFICVIEEVPRRSNPDLSIWILEWKEGRRRKKNTIHNPEHTFRFISLEWSLAKVDIPNGRQIFRWHFIKLVAHLFSLFKSVCRLWAFCFCKMKYFFSTFLPFATSILWIFSPWRCCCCCWFWIFFDSFS